jgi:hypothetical protein
MKQEVLTAERRKQAREIAAHTFVLLKNNPSEGGALPLKNQERSVDRAIGE